MVRRRNTPGTPDPRGGVRQGAPGKAYANRSDMTAAPAAPTQPVRVATGQGYGVAGAQAASQAAVPLPAQSPPPTGAAPVHDVAAAAFDMPQLGAFDRATERPDEALTHGAPTGPGAGPEVMPGLGAPTGMSGLLRQIAGAVGSSDLEALAARAESLGH